MLKVKTDLGCRVYVDGEYMGIAKAGVINRFDFGKAEYWVRYEALTDSSVFIERVVITQEWDILEVIELRPIMRSFVMQSYQEGTLWGFKELFSGLTIVSPAYTEVEEFSGCYAVVKKGKSYGILSDSGKEVLTCDYDKITRVANSCFIVESCHRVAVFNPDTPDILCFDYDEWDYVWNEEKGLIESTRKKEPGIISVRQSGRIGVYDSRDNTMLLPCEYKRIGFPTGITERRLAYKDNGCDILTERCEKVGTIPEINNYAKIYFLGGDYIRVQSEGLIGIVDLQGNVVVPCKYYHIDNDNVFYNGLALVAIFEKNNRKYKYGFVNEKGEEVIPCIYDHAARFTNRVTFASRREAWGGPYKRFLIDLHGNELFEIHCKYDIATISPFYKGVAVFSRVLNSGDRGGIEGGLITERGKIIFESRGGQRVQSEWASEYFEGGCCLIYNEEASYDSDWNGDEEYVYITGVESSMGVLDVDGRQIVPIKRYEYLSYIDGYYTDYDSRERILIPETERAVVCSRNNKKGTLNREGEELIPCDYEDVDISIDYANASSIAIVEIEGKKALFDIHDGEQITSFRFDYIRGFHNGRAFAEEDGHVVVIDRFGDIMLRTPYSRIQSVGLDSCCACSGSDVAVILLDSLRIFPIKNDSNHVIYSSIENGLVMLNSYTLDRWNGYETPGKWKSKRILDVQTGFEYLPEVNIELSITNSENCFRVRN